MGKIYMYIQNTKNKIQIMNQHGADNNVNFLLRVGEYSP